MGGGGQKPTELFQTPNAGTCCLGVRLWELSFVVERGIAQTNS